MNTKMTIEAIIRESIRNNLSDSTGVFAVKEEYYRIQGMIKLAQLMGMFDPEEAFSFTTEALCEFNSRRPDLISQIKLESI